MTHAVKKILVTGASGFIGTPLCRVLTARGYQVFRTTRDPAKKADPYFVYWAPDSHTIDQGALVRASPDAIIHLAGPTVGRYWWPWYKKYLLSNRVASANLLVKACLALPHQPRVFIGVSAIGYYGASETPVTEASPKGSGFAADLVAQMEHALTPLKTRGIRTVHARLGVVLGRGGALKQMLPAFRLGLGGPMGHGQQPMSWIALEDVLGALIFVLNMPKISDKVNVTAPEPTDNAHFSRMLAQILHRPCLLTMPAFVVRLLFGQMGQELLLQGAPVMPTVLQKHGYAYVAPHLEEAFRHALKAPNNATKDDDSMLN